jgi:hypothetical protein
VTLYSIAKACLAVLLAACPSSVQAVGSWLAQRLDHKQRRAMGRAAPDQQAEAVRSRWQGLEQGARASGMVEAALARGA